MMLKRHYKMKRGKKDEEHYNFPYTVKRCGHGRHDRGEGFLPPAQRDVFRQRDKFLHPERERNDRE